MTWSQKELTNLTPKFQMYILEKEGSRVHRCGSNLDEYLLRKITSVIS